MRELRTSIVDEVKRLCGDEPKRIRGRQAATTGNRKQLAEAVSQSRSTSSAELTIRELESRAKELRSLYDTFLQRYMGAAQQENFPISETRVIYPAVPPPTKSKPNTALNADEVGAGHHRRCAGLPRKGRRNRVCRE